MYNPTHAAVRAVKSLSLRGRIIASAAALALIGGGGIALAAGAGAATNACGHNCIDISFLSSGPTWLLNDSKGLEQTNATVSQQRGSNGGNQGRNEDFEAYGVGTVDAYYCPGGIDPVFTANQCAALDNAGLGSSTAYEVEYYPYGGDGSGLCISAWDGQNPVPSGYKARFQPCGQNADSIMIVTASLDHGAFHTAGGFWVVSGGSDNFSHPVVLTNNGQQQWQNLTWQTVETDGSGGVVNQEVDVTPGPYF
jgi:hypothetical protein